ncbi:YetF domain-containing protein [Mucilaginibacter arboris]|uniref:DUF421 domain-containing protein n=1 Tax=Mucilaginibacter arboris TaxID=2682090 RepID=A0A7K1T0N1_9SPHI|nr:YetF domain-containing protein [Mucilaginibacter arboris]MVN23119.1 DUF421 domain-containing protein [Mucilaginibacter arboris]
MKPSEMHLTDWARILVGDVPGSFYVEVVIRAIVFYLLLLVAIRLMGKRMSSQLSRNDLAAMVSLAAAIGVPLQAPDRGILPAVIIALIVVVVARWIAAKSFKDQKFEKFSQGNVGMLVKDSVMDLETMKKSRLTRERLVAQLRSKNIKQLGSVKRFYMEASGSFTLIEEEKPKPGLSIIPHWDKDFQSQFKKHDEIQVCQTCGLTQGSGFDVKNKCPNCGDKNWTEAVE